MAILGNRAKAPASITLNANNKVAGQFTAGSSFEATFIGIEIANLSATESIRLGIYDESGGEPDALLGTTAEFEGAGTTGEWIFLSLLTSVSITSSNNYWLAVITDGTVFPGYTTGSGTYRDNADTFAGGFADPFGASSSTTGDMAIYAGSADETFPIKIQYAGALNLGSGGAVGSSSGGVKWAVTATSLGVQAWENVDNLSTQGEIGSVQSPTTIFGSSGELYWMDAVIDSANVVHVIAAGDVGATRDIAYNTISDIDSSPAWGTWETVLAAYDQIITATTDIHCSIDLDENDDPHAVFTDFFKVHGTTYTQTFYTEKTGASWTTPELLDTNDNAFYRHADLIITTTGPDGYLLKKQGAVVRDQYLTNGTWASETAVTSGPIPDIDAGRLRVNARGSTEYAYVNNNTTDSAHELVDGVGANVSSGVDPTLQLPIAAHVDADGVRRLLFAHASSDNPEWFENDGGGWTNLAGYFDEHEVAGGSVTAGVVMGAQYRNQNNDIGIDVLLSDGFGVYYKQWLFPVPFFFPGGPNLNPVYRM